MTVPTFDLDILKDDIGMPPGTENDAWLLRRVEGVWSRMETYCNRHLGSLTSFRDVWKPAQIESNVGAYWPYSGGVVYYLRHYPVKEILLAIDGDQLLPDPASVLFNPHNGALLGYGPTGSPTYFSLPQIAYTAGYDPIPPDLYESMVGILQSVWNARSNAKSGLATGGMIPSQIDIADVGSITLGGGNTASGFSSTLIAGGDYNDPMLGPYMYVLDGYRDKRAEMGSVLMPMTDDLGPAP